MIFELEVFSITSHITHFTFGVFLVATILSGYKMTKSDGINESMAYALAALYLGWSLLEFIWIWRLIPGPYSI